MNPKSKKPVRRGASTAYLSAPIEELTAGQLFRVRDKDWDNVWAENISHDEAHKLKEKIATSGKSRTVRIESMEIDPPEWYQPHRDHLATGNAMNAHDPKLESLRRQAQRNANLSAADAKKRHELAAARDRSSAAAAIRPMTRPVPVISTEAPSEADDAELDAGGIGDEDLSDFMADAGGDIPSDLELQRAKDQAAKDAAAITARAKAMYEAQMKDGSVTWENLPKSAQQGWRHEAQTPPPEPTNSVSDDAHS